MYYREKLINGIWHYKTTPTMEWKQMSIMQLINKIAAKERELNKLRLGVVSNNEAVEKKKLQKQHIIDIMQKDEELNLYSEVTVCCETCKHLDNDNTRECNKCDDGFCMWKQQTDF